METDQPKVALKLSSYLKVELLSQEDINNVLEKACHAVSEREDNKEIISFIISNVSIELINPDNLFRIIYACESSKDQEILRRLKVKNAWNLLDELQFKYLLERCAIEGHTHLFHDLIKTERFAAIEQPLLTALILESVHSNHVEILQALLNSSKHSDLQLRDLEQALLISARLGRYEIANELINSPRYSEMSIGTIEKALRYSCRKNHNCVAELLLQCERSNEISNHCLGRALIESAKANNLLSFRELLNNHRLKITFTHLTGALIASSEKGHLAMVSSLLELDRIREVPQIPGSSIQECLDRCISLSAKNEHLTTLQILLENRSPPLSSLELVDTFFTALCYDRVEIVEYLITELEFEQKDIDDAFITIAKQNCDKSGQAIIKNEKFEKVSLKIFTDAFKYCCYYGNKALARAFMESHRFNEIPLDQLQIAFGHSAQQQHPEITKLFLQLKQFQKIEPAIFAFVLVSCCRFGYVDLVQQLIHLPAFQEISTKQFILACQEALKENHKQIAHVLLSCERIHESDLTTLTYALFKSVDYFDQKLLKSMINHPKFSEITLPEITELLISCRKRNNVEGFKCLFAAKQKDLSPQGIGALLIDTIAHWDNAFAFIILEEPSLFLRVETAHLKISFAEAVKNQNTEIIDALLKGSRSSEFSKNFIFEQLFYSSCNSLQESYEYLLETYSMLDPSVDKESLRRVDLELLL